MNTYYSEIQEYKIARDHEETSGKFYTRMANEIQIMTDKIVDVAIGLSHIVIYYRIKMNSDHTIYKGE